LQLTPDERQKYEEMDELLLPTRNFRNYRDAIKNARPPRLPYLGLFRVDDFRFLLHVYLSALRVYCLI
jgi:hypothetical protein